jgi:anaerobic selenocysteine-containing dehydrogenase
MAQVIVGERLFDGAYLREQTDLPFLVRVDDGRFLREGDVSGETGARDNLFYVWDEASGRAVAAPATGNPPPPPGSPVPVIPAGSLALGALRPALEGRWTVRGAGGKDIEVTTVFELLKKRLADYTPDKAAAVTGVNAANIRDVALRFARAKPAMIFTGYRMCKWLHGDLLQRAFMLLLSLTGNLGKPGGGLQLENLARVDSQLAFMLDGVPPTFRVATLSRWDYAHADGRSLNERVYGKELADDVEKHYRESIRLGWFPDYAATPWKMGFFAGSNTANWRASGGRWRQEGFAKLDTIVSMTPDMGVTAMYADYVLPIAHHYERQDYMLEARTPYVQVLDVAVPPLGEAVDDWTALDRIAKAISERAAARGIGPVTDDLFGQPLPRDLGRVHALYRHEGKVNCTRDVIQFLIDRDEGVPKVPFAEMAAAGIMRNDDAHGVVYGPKAPYGSVMIRAVEGKEPYPTLTGRQQFYVDHEWFMAEDEALPRHKDPLAISGYPLRFTMGHVRHGIHSMWTDDAFLLNLRRGEPDVYVSVEDAKARDVSDGDPIRIFNNFGSFTALANVTSAMQPGQIFMYHGWDPMMFRDRQNFGGVIPTAGLLKPTSLVGGYGHITYRALAFEPNHTFHDFTCNFEKQAPYERASRDSGAVKEGLKR